ncbi:MAG: hypothetical protein LCH30_10590 [Proteobacteria bacterium]|nr:hypothetical protein [Pseudomonadota bacterium]
MPLTTFTTTIPPKPKVVDVTVTIKGFDNSPRFHRKNDIGDINNAIVKEKNKGLKCTSSEALESAFRVGERFAKQDSVSVSILGKINKEQIDEVFSKLSDFKKFLIEKGIPAETEEEFIQSLMPSPRGPGD